MRPHKLLDVFKRDRHHETPAQLERSRPINQPDHSSAVLSAAQEVITIDDHLTVSKEQELAQGHIYPSVNASGNSSLILGDVHEVHYHTHSTLPDARAELLSSLHFREMSMRYDNIDDPHSDTFQWILKPSEDEHTGNCDFLEWLKSEGSMFWISGKPGSGKSVLMKYLSQNITDATGPTLDPVIVLSFWFWEAAHQELERSLIGCLRSLLWQILQIQIHSYSITEAIGHHSSFAWTKRRLCDALNSAMKILAGSGARILMFLDGLDECGSDVNELLNFVKDITKNFSTIKLCVSSRPEPIFQQSLALYPYLKMQDLNQADITTIVQQDLLEAPEFVSVSHSTSELRAFGEFVVYEAQGVILWVRLVIRDLLINAANGDTLAELSAHLERLPVELEGEDGLFAFMLKRNARYSKHYLREASLYLQLACHTTMSMLAFSLAANDNLRSTYLQFEEGWQTRHCQLDCERLGKAVVARTGGLLEADRSKSSSLRIRAARTRDVSLTRLLNDEDPRYVDFVHRTARSFVLETKTGQELLTKFPLEASQIRRIIFEARLVVSVQLRCLESVVPLALRSFYDCEPEHDDEVETFKEMVRTLVKRNSLWTEHYAGHWMSTGTFRKPPLPLLPTEGKDINFAHVFAELGSGAHVIEELKRIVPLSHEHLASVLSTVCRTLGAYVEGRAAEVNEVCAWIISLGVHPGCELLTAFGERISLYNEMLPVYLELNVCSPSVKPMAIENWLAQSRNSTLLTKYQPTMTQCSDLFFSHVSGYEDQGDVFLLTPMCSGDLEIVLRRYLTPYRDPFPNEEMRICCGDLDTTHDSWIWFVWDPNTWKPSMYLTKSEGFTKLLDARDMKWWSFGIFHWTNSYHYDFLDTVGQAQAIKSLCEAFRLLGKSEASIEAFLAVEKPRIRLTFDKVMYEAWLSWVYGTEETPDDAYYNIPRPDTYQQFWYSIHEDGEGLYDPSSDENHHDKGRIGRAVDHQEPMREADV